MNGRSLFVSCALLLAAGLASASAETMLFEENFNDGDYSGWTYWAPGSGSSYVQVESGKLHIKRWGAGGSGRSTGIKRDDVYIPLTDTVFTRFDVRADYSSVRNATGDGNTEYPMTYRLKLDSPQGDRWLYFSYNDDGGWNKLWGSGNHYQYGNDLPGDTWVYDETYRLRDHFTDATAITEIALYGSGWDFEGWIDDIEIYDTAGAAVPAPLAVVLIPTLLVMGSMRRWG